MSWSHPTYAEAYAEAPDQLRCACRRWVAPTEYYLLPTLPDAASGHALVYVCAACLETRYQQGSLSPAAVMAALGAPPEMVARWERKRTPRGHSA